MVQSESARDTGAVPPATVRWWSAAVARHRAGVPDIIDVMLAVGSFMLFTGPLLIGLVDGYGSTPSIAAAGVLTAAPLILRRKAPVAVLLVVAIVLCAAAILGVRFTPFVSNLGPAFALAILTVADMRDRRTSLVSVIVATVAVSAAAIVVIGIHSDQDQNLVQLLIAVPAWLIGDAIRTRRRYARDLRIAAAENVAEIERRAKAEERLRVSRDVHDVVSHSLGVIAVRSGVARMLVDQQPEEARDALLAIETASRDALAELRSVLRKLRDPSDVMVADDPQIGDIARIIADLRGLGHRIDARFDSGLEWCSPLVQSTTVRVVQEALTNAVRHGGAEHIDVDIGCTSRELKISVIDDGCAEKGGAAGVGLGLVGMRERVGLLGGSLDAGPRSEGGFSVRATIPIGEND